MFFLCSIESDPYLISVSLFLIHWVQPIASFQWPVSIVYFFLHCQLSIGSSPWAFTAAFITLNSFKDRPLIPKALELPPYLFLSIGNFFLFFLTSLYSSICSILLSIPTAPGKLFLFSLLITSMLPNSISKFQASLLFEF